MAVYYGNHNTIVYNMTCIGTGHLMMCAREWPICRPWQIIHKDSPIILFFYSQIFSLLFSQTSPLFSNSYSKSWLSKHSDDIYISSQKQQKLIAMTSARPSAFKLTPKTTAFGKVNSLHMRMQCRVQKSLCTVTIRQCIILKLFILVPIILKLF